MVDLTAWIIMVAIVFWITPSICSIANSLKKIADK